MGKSSYDKGINATPVPKDFISDFRNTTLYKKMKEFYPYFTDETFEKWGKKYPEFVTEFVQNNKNFEHATLYAKMKEAYPYLTEENIADWCRIFTDFAMKFKHNNKVPQKKEVECGAEKTIKTTKELENVITNLKNANMVKDSFAMDAMEFFFELSNNINRLKGTLDFISNRKDN